MRDVLALIGLRSQDLRGHNRNPRPASPGSTTEVETVHPLLSCAASTVRSAVPDRIPITRGSQPGFPARAAAVAGGRGPGGPGGPVGWADRPDGTSGRLYPVRWNIGPVSHEHGRLGTSPKPARAAGPKGGRGAAGARTGAMGRARWGGRFGARVKGGSGQLSRAVRNSPASAAADSCDVWPDSMTVKAMSPRKPTNQLVQVDPVWTRPTWP